jgi:hypothetical protein
VSGLTDTICSNLWQRLEPMAVDALRAAVLHWPIIDPDTRPGENKHVLCYCSDQFAYLDDWLDHAIVEVSADMTGERVG